MAKADKLLNLNYAKRVKDQGGISVSVSYTKGQPIQLQHNLPDENDRDATLLTARQFVQNNDPISLGNMAKLLGDPTLSNDWKTRFSDGRDTFNQFLNSNSTLKVSSGILTHRQVFDSLLYGDYAHSDAVKKAVIAEFQLNDESALLLENEFQSVLCQLIGTVQYIAYYCRLELDGLEFPEFPSL